MLASDPALDWTLLVQVVVPASIAVQPNSTATMDVAYRPLLAAESAATLKLTSKELGLYQYALRLKGAPAGPERSMAFSVALGNTETQVGWADAGCSITWLRHLCLKVLRIQGQEWQPCAVVGLVGGCCQLMIC